MFSRRRAQEMWTRTPMPEPTTYERFLKEAHGAANDEQFEQLLVTATREDLMDIVRELRKRLAGAEFAARINGETIEAMRRRAHPSAPQVNHE